MEASLYQEGVPGKTQEMKKNMFLDFGSGNTKQQKYASLLASPDFNMLKLGSPELEKMILASTGGLLQTPTPTQFIYPKYVTDEQEAYARGFVEALAQLHGGMPGQPPSALPGPSTSTLENTSQPATQSEEEKIPTYSQLMPITSAAAAFSASTVAATTLASMSGINSVTGPKRPYQFIPSALAAPSKPPTSTIPSALVGLAAGASLNVQVKDEPSYSDLADHTVPSSMLASPTPSSSRQSDGDSPALSPSSTINMDNDNMPIDMNNQEVIKVERKRARNRIAARKCRTRKLERISRLEEKVNDLKNKNNDLLQHATSLNEQVVQLKQQIVDHMKTGCQIMMPNTGLLQS